MNELTQQPRSFRRFKEGDSKPSDWQEEIFQAGWSHKCPTYVHKTPPCQGSCPAGHDVRGWLSIVRGLDKGDGKTGWQEYAFRRMTASNPFPSIMGRVCPAPCEDGCNRNQVEDHVGINAVEHFVGDWALGNKLGFASPDAESGFKVAVIGGGPGGMSAAYHLRRRGHAVTIFEDRDALGGMIRFGIPGYRAPRNVLDGEIQRILDMGVEVRLNTRVGRDVSLEQLDGEFNAVFWAIGTHAGRKLPVPGADAPNVITGVEFLRAFNEGRLAGVARNIVVIGGGDTSIDVASVARRIGHITEIHPKDRPDHLIFNDAAHDAAMVARKEGADVTLTSLFPVEQMTAAEQEIDDATREGVNIRGSVMPLEIRHDESGRANAIKLCQCDTKGMTPIPREGTEFIVPCDLIVVAIGQMGDLTGLEALNNGKGFIDAGKDLAVKGRKGHFAGGDIVRPHLLVTAIGHGRIAAESIDRHLSSEEAQKRPRVDVVHFDMIDRMGMSGIAPARAGAPLRGTSDSNIAVHNYEDRGPQEIIPHEELFLGYFPTTPRIQRQHVEIASDAVLGNFAERLVALDEAQVVAEAKRCMTCGLCNECDSCLVYCPQHAIERVPRKDRAPGRYVMTDYTKCIGCHICHDVCPSGYIKMGLGE